MDPASISGGAVAAARICLLAGQGLYNLRDRYRHASNTIGAICAESDTIAASLGRIQQMADNNAYGIGRQLKDAPRLRDVLDDSLVSCTLIYSRLDKEVKRLQQGTMTRWGKTRFVMWSEDTMKDLLQSIRAQNTAMTMLLQCLQMTSSSELHVRVEELSRRVAGNVARAQSLQIQPEMLHEKEQPSSGPSPVGHEVENLSRAASASPSNPLGVGSEGVLAYGWNKEEDSASVAGLAPSTTYGDDSDSIADPSDVIEEVASTNNLDSNEWLFSPSSRYSTLPLYDESTRPDYLRSAAASIRISRVFQTPSPMEVAMGTLAADRDNDNVNLELVTEHETEDSALQETNDNPDLADHWESIFQGRTASENAINPDGVHPPDPAAKADTPRETPNSADEWSRMFERSEGGDAAYQQSERPPAEASQGGRAVHDSNNQMRNALLSGVQFSQRRKPVPQRVSSDSARATSPSSSQLVLNTDTSAEAGNPRFIAGVGSLDAAEEWERLMTTETRLTVPNTQAQTDRGSRVRRPSRLTRPLNLAVIELYCAMQEAGEVKSGT